MRKCIAIIALLATATLTFAQKAGDKISFSSQDLSGAAVTDSLFAKNKLTMVNVWGTFCGPCIREMPDLAELNKEYKDKGFEIVGIPIDIVDRTGNILPRTKASGESIIAQTGANYTHIVPNKAMLSGFLKYIQVVPTTLFVDSEGTLVDTVYLGSRSKKDWQKIIDNLLKK